MTTIGGVNIVEKGELTLVTTLSEFIEWAAQFNQGGYLFRGVTNEKYSISASAYRRLQSREDGDESGSVNFEKFVQINRGLIRDIRLQDLDWRGGRKLRDLEILAELQHFQAATCLMDFTYNALVALWFACYPSYESASRCGKVVAVYVNDEHKFREVTLELLEKDIDHFFLGNDNERHQQLYKWRPPHQNNRIIAQQSVFLFGAVEINPDKGCLILGSKKAEIRESLEQVHGITNEMLFPDFDGFARQHGQSAPYTQFAASQYRERGEQKMQEKEYTEAIAAFTEAIKVNPGNTRDYHNRGFAMQELLGEPNATNANQYDRVIADYTEAIDLDPDTPYAYYFRGVLRSKIGSKYQAVLDLEDALRIAKASGDQEFIDEVQRHLHGLQSHNNEDSEDT